MKVELHLHTNRYSACAVATPGEFMRRLVEIGYEAVYITEHDAVWSEWEIAQLQAGHPLIRIFPGLERTLSAESMQHLLILGTTDPAYLQMEDPAEVLEKARAEGHLTILAHPFRWEGAAGMLDSGLRPDALECYSSNHTAAEAARAAQAAERLKLALVNTGDSHGLHSLNRFWIETDQPLQKADDIRRIVMNKAYVNWVGEAE
jgi:predicted metal-dependent phosphoesterase TrpH